MVRLFLKTLANFFNIVIYNGGFNVLHPQLSLFLFALESPLWCFSSLANHHFKVSQHFSRNLGRRRNDSKYRDVAPLSLCVAISL